MSTAPRKRIIVCGGRQYRNRAVIRAVICALFEKHGPFVLVHGAGAGADQTAQYCAEDYNEDSKRLGYDDMMIAIEPHEAKWREHGKAAGPIRNKHMASLGADGCVAFPGGRGTANMVETAKAHGIPVWDLRGHIGLELP